MLNAMRSRAGGLAAKLLLVLLIASFAVWGIEDMLRNTGQTGPLATVGGKEISRAAFQQEYSNQLNRVRTMLGKNYSPELVRMLGIERQVIEQLILSELTQLEMQNLGLLPGDDVVRDTIRLDPSFQNDKGAFDKAKFIAVLRNNGLTEQSFATEIRRAKANQLLVNAISAVPAVNGTMVATQFEAQAEERTADIAVLETSMIRDVKAPGDEDVETYYKQHATEFNLPENRTLSYVIVKREELLKGVSVSEAQLKEAYKERAAMFGEAAAPFEQVKGDIERELKAEHAEEAASSFSRKLEDLLAGGSTLQEAAKELGLSYATIGPVTAEGLGAKGEKVALPPYENFLKTAFRLEEGSDSALTATKDNTYFLVRAEKVTPEQPKPLAEVRAEVISAWKAQEAAKQLQAKAEIVAKKAKESKNPRDVFAAENISLRPSGILHRGAPKSSTNMTLPGGLVQELFAVRTGQATGAYPAGDGQYMIGILKDRREPAKVSKEALRSNMELKQLRAKLEDESKRLAGEEYISYLRTKYHVTINDEALNALTSAQ